MTPAEKQAAYAAKRPRLTPAVPMVDYRIILRDGAERIERFPDMARAGAAYPEAAQITRCDFGGFY